MYASLHLTLACNLRCRYCYAGTKQNRPMAPETARQAVDFLVANEKDEDIVITFFGGEPLLRPEILKDVVLYGEKIRGEKKIVFRMTTNATLLTDEMIGFCKKHELFFAVSLDGDRDTHDTNRRMADGRGSFDRVMEKIPAILKNNPYTVVVAVVNPETARHLSANVRFLFETGFQYLLLTPDFGAPWDERSMAVLREEYAKVADYYIDVCRRKEKLYINLIDEKIRTHAWKGARKDCASCDVARRQIAIAPSGTIYPCVQFVGDDDERTAQFRIGDVRGGFDEERRWAFIRRNHLPKTDCAGCTLEGRCMNWCACANYQTSGDIARPSPVICEHERMLVPIADRAGETLYAEKNELFLAKTYDRAWPLISFIDDCMQGKASL